MKFKEKFKIKDWAHTGLGFSVIGKPRLIDKPISGLLIILKEAGLNIIETASEVIYGQKEKIPLHFYLGVTPEVQSTISVIGYYLKGKSLEISLGYATESDAPKTFDIHTPIGPSHIESSLDCSLTLIGEYEEGKILKVTRSKIEEFYNPYADNVDVEAFKKAFKGRNFLKGLRK